MQERNIADTGLNLLLEMLQMFAQSDFATQFHKTYFLSLVQEIFAVMTGAQLHATRATLVLWPLASIGQAALQLPATPQMTSHCA